MSTNDLIIAIGKNDPQVKKDLFEQHYELMSSMALRFSKNDAQAKEMLFEAFTNILQNYANQRPIEGIEFGDFLKKEFLKEAIAFIKAIRSEYYVASTVLATRDSDKTFNLFDSPEMIDFNTVDTPVLIRSLQELVPSQRLVFNLYVIDGIDLQVISDMLEASEQTVKSNLEKARFNLQKNVEKNNRNVKHEQAL